MACSPWLTWRHFGKGTVCKGRSRVLGFPRWFSGSRIDLWCRRPGFDPWFRKIPWSRKWQPTPVFLPKGSHGLWSLGDYKSIVSQRVRHDCLASCGSRCSLVYVCITSIPISVFISSSLVCLLCVSLVKTLVIGLGMLHSKGLQRIRLNNSIGWGLTQLIEDGLNSQSVTSSAKTLLSEFGNIYRFQGFGVYVSLCVWGWITIQPTIPTLTFVTKLSVWNWTVSPKGYSLALWAPLHICSN